MWLEAVHQSIRGGVDSINQKSVCRKTRLNSNFSKVKRGGDSCQLKKPNIFEKEEKQIIGKIQI